MDNEDETNSGEASSANLAGTITSSYPLMLGIHHIGHNRSFPGFADEIAIWDEELTANGTTL